MIWKTRHFGLLEVYKEHPKIDLFTYYGVKRHKMYLACNMIFISLIFKNILVIELKDLPKIIWGMTDCSLTCSVCA